jgi:hypothetical protein
MSARTKLNAVAFGAVLMFAALSGTLASSWLVFVLVAVVGSVLMIHTGEVRLRPSVRNARQMRRKQYSR